MHLSLPGLEIVKNKGFYIRKNGGFFGFKHHLSSNSLDSLQI
jgi:hypothetical protein